MLEGPFFEAISETVFSEIWCQMEPQMALKIKENVVKNETWNEVEQTCTNVLKMMPLDLWKTSYRMDGLQKYIKTRGAGKCKNMSKKGVKRSHTSMQNGPWSSTKKHA